jgi:hypothetical protein
VRISGRRKRRLELASLASLPPALPAPSVHRKCSRASPCIVPSVPHPSFITPSHLAHLRGKSMANIFIVRLFSLLVCLILVGAPLWLMEAKQQCSLCVKYCRAPWSLNIVVDVLFMDPNSTDTSATLFAAVSSTCLPPRVPPSAAQRKTPCARLLLQNS